MGGPSITFMLPLPGWGVVDIDQDTKTSLCVVEPRSSSVCQDPDKSMVLTSDVLIAYSTTKVITIDQPSRRYPQVVRDR